MDWFQCHLIAVIANDGKWMITWLECSGLKATKNFKRKISLIIKKETERTVHQNDNLLEEE